MGVWHPPISDATSCTYHMIISSWDCFLELSFCLLIFYILYNAELFYQECFLNVKWLKSWTTSFFSETCRPCSLCELPKNSGHGSTLELRYFFNTAIGICQGFLYHGINRNKNNFKTKQSCHNHCFKSCKTSCYVCRAFQLHKYFTLKRLLYAWVCLSFSFSFICLWLRVSVQWFVCLSVECAQEMSGFQNIWVCPQAFPHLRTQSPRKRLLLRLCKGQRSCCDGLIIYIRFCVCMRLHLIRWTFCQQNLRCNKCCNTTTTTNNWSI